MSELAQRIVGIHRALDSDRILHAFGGALALAWCTQRPRGTSDIDLNIFLGVDAVDRLLGALPDAITPTDEQRALLERDGQARLWWADTPVDLFLSTTPFHADALLRVVHHEFAGASVPFLSCTDLAVFKAFFDRTKHWADLEEMVHTGSLDHERTLGVLATYLDLDDPRIRRLRSLVVDR